MSNTISTTANSVTLAVTAGEPSGIGPDLCAFLVEENFPASIVILADGKMMRERGEMLGLSFEIPDYIPGSPAGLSLLNMNLASKAFPGRLDPSNSSSVLKTIERAVEGCMRKEFDALVTAPVHKGVINDAGFEFSGHTELLAALSGTEHVVMMLAGGGMRVSLATTHLPLRAVPDALTGESLDRTLRILHRDLKSRFGIPSPNIVVAGLNPHAGESGHMGREEIEVIEPVMKTLRNEGMRLEGPLPADTLFNHLSGCDCVLAMYHDQGLPVLKYASFGHGVNITLGLPFVRTSVDHGTALSLAGTGKMDRGSLKAAIHAAIQLAEKSK